MDTTFLRACCPAGDVPGSYTPLPPCLKQQSANVILWSRAIGKGKIFASSETRLSSHDEINDIFRDSTSTLRGTDLEELRNLPVKGLTTGLRHNYQKDETLCCQILAT